MIQNDSIILRAVEPQDVDLLYQWENDMELWNVSNTLVPFSRYLLKRYVEESHLDIYQTRQLRLMIDNIQKQTVGIIDLFDFEPFHQRAGVGIMIHGDENRGKGYAKNALNLLVDYCFDTLALHQLYCNINVENLTSQHLFEAAGFSRVGICKEWLKEGNQWKDIIQYQLLAK